MPCVSVGSEKVLVFYLGSANKNRDGSSRPVLAKSKKDLAVRLSRWVMQLMEYKYTIVHDLTSLRLCVPKNLRGEHFTMTVQQDTWDGPGVEFRTVDLVYLSFRLLISLVKCKPSLDSKLSVNYFEV